MRTASQPCLVWDTPMTGQESLTATTVLHGSLVGLFFDFNVRSSRLTRLLSDFQVTKPLPNVTWPLPRNFAGSIAVDRAGHPNNTLFFWGFEKERGSLTTPAHEHSDRPWGIWLNGGYVLHPRGKVRKIDWRLSQAWLFKSHWPALRGITVSTSSRGPAKFLAERTDSCCKRLLLVP